MSGTDRRRGMKCRHARAVCRAAAAAAAAARGPRLSYHVESIESRLLLAASPIGSEFRANELVGNNQFAAAVAADADGDFVVAWTSDGQDGSSHGVYAQRFNAGGVEQGPEFPVNTTTANRQNAPAVAMDADGDFVVVWQSEYQDNPSAAVYAQRFSAAGTALGDEFRVNTTVAGNQMSPAVAMDVDGDFVVAWASGAQDGDQYGVYARRFDAAGVAQGGEIPVNTTTVGTQRDPAVALDADGDFAVAWWGAGVGDAEGVHARRFNAAGAAQGAEFRVNTHTTGLQWQPVAAADADGDFVIAWWAAGPDDTYGVYARRYNAAGAAQGDPLRANTTTAGVQGPVAVAMDASGDFALAWETGGQDGSGYGVYARRFDAAGNPQAGEARVNTAVAGFQGAPAVAMDAEGDHVVAWQSFGQDGSGYGVYAQRYDESSDTAGPLVTDVGVPVGSIAPGERLVETVPALKITFSEALGTAGGSTGANSATNAANYGLTRGGVDVSSQIASAAFALNAATAKYETTLTFTPPLQDGSYVVTARSNLRDPAGNLLDVNQDGTPGGGGDFPRAFTINSPVRTGPEFRVNPDAEFGISTPVVATRADGAFVVAWTVGSTSSSDIWARRYDAGGTPLDAPFRVNDVDGGTHRDPLIAMDADGDFVVTWTGDDQSGYGVYARRFTAAGTAQGGDVQVNTFTPSVQRPETAAMDDVGNFVIAWMSLQQDVPAEFAWGVYARRFDALAQTWGPEFRVNTTVAGSQLAAGAAMDADGDFVIVWSGPGPGPGSNGADIFAQRYTRSGAPKGGEFPVNQHTFGGQDSPVVAMDDDGDFVVAWSTPDVSSSGVVAGRFDANGIPRGNQVLVNTTTDTFQTSATVAIDADGDFVVTWNGNGPGDDSGVFAQRFNAALVRQGGEFRVNTPTFGFQQNRGALAMDADGDFVVAWHSGPGTNPGPGVYAQRFAANEAPVSFGIASVNVQQDGADAQDTVIDLRAAFEDSSDPDPLLAYALVGNTNPGLFSSTSVNNTADTLTLDYAPGQSGQSTMTVRATDTGGLFVDTGFTVTLTSTGLPAWLGAGSVATWNAATKALNVTGAASIIADPGADAPLVTASGAAAVLSINTPAAGQVNLGGLQLSGNASASVNSAGAARVVVIANGASLTLDATATLDLTDNALVVRNATQSAAFAKHTSVNNLVRNAFADFTWNQPGVTSSTAAADVSGGTPSSLGILLNNDGGGGPLFYGPGTDQATFMGAAVDANTVMVRFTRLGDGDLNGAVDSVDFALFQAGYTGAAPYTGFAFGDYDYNGGVDSVDFGLFQAGYQAAGSVGGAVGDDDDDERLTLVGSSLAD